MLDKNEDNTYYVLHVRVEKVIISLTTSLKTVTGAKNDRDVEDVVNVVKKSDTLMAGIDFVKGVLDLTLDTDN